MKVVEMVFLKRAFRDLIVKNTPTKSVMVLEVLTFISTFNTSNFKL